MKNDEIKAKVLGVQILPNIDEALRVKYRLRKNLRSLGILTTDCDDVSYVALDEATKKAQVQVAYAASMYGGSGNASTLLAGEFIGILAGENPEEITSGLEAAIDFIENRSCFYSANQDNSIIYYAQCISRTGSYLSKIAKIAEGEPLSYLIAPPLEAMMGIDTALKAAAVDLKVLYKAPTNTNFSGALLTGDQAACQAACDAFANTVCQVADRPRMI